jgi:sortase A
MNRLVALVLGAMITLGVVQYAPARAWLTDYENRKEMIRYAETLTSQGSTITSDVVLAAQKYNEDLQNGAVAFSQSGESTDNRYLKQLRTGDSPTIGNLNYDALNIRIPLAMGTGDDVLERYAGHLYTTALPIGGEGNRPILSAHSGQNSARGFTPLLKARIGQQFSITTAAGTIWYEVSAIEEVLPWEVEKVAAVPGADLVTLMTCTPIGQNTHRLLVTGHRVDGPATAGAQALSFWAYPGLPWPFIQWAGAVALTALIGKYFYITRPARKAEIAAALAAGKPIPQRRRGKVKLVNANIGLPELQGA